MDQNRMNSYENKRWQKAFSASAAGTAIPGCSCDSRQKNASDRSLSYFWCGTHIGSQLAQGASARRQCIPEGAQEYPAIRRQANAKHAQIHWGDEMGMRSDHQAGRSYGLKGHTPVIPGTGQRFGCNMISTVTNRGRLAFMIFKERFTGTVMIDFLRRLIKHNKQKVFLIVDGHPVHRSRQVKRWVHRHRKRIRMFFLPGYSPQLNPDELLNQDVKTNAVGRNRPQNQPEMMQQVRSHLRSTQRRPRVVKNYFKHKDVQYAAT